MIVINFTGLERWHLIPTFAGDGVPGARLWLCSVRWIGVEITVNSIVMGTEMIRRFNKSTKEVMDEHGTD